MTALKRRSFFGLLFGGLLARWLPPPSQIRFRGAVIPIRQYVPGEPTYHFGFTGFKPPQSNSPPWLQKWVQLHHPEAAGTTARVIIDRRGVAWWALDRDVDQSAGEQLYLVRG